MRMLLAALMAMFFVSAAHAQWGGYGYRPQPYYYGGYGGGYYRPPVQYYHYYQPPVYYHQWRTESYWRQCWGDGC